jgi:argininosuccinate lyase
MKIWSKGNDELNKIVEDYCSGNDILYDQKLVKWDVVGSIAHALMLEKQGLVSKDECEEILKGLGNILDLDSQGKFILDKNKEDVHTNVEFFLGEVGKKLHTGRSRNDQVAVDMKLYMKEQLVEVAEAVIEVCKILEDKSKNGWIMMPGYTHMQKAMPTTFSHYLLSYYELLLQDFEFLLKVFEVLDKNPLGAGASFGSILDIDKKFTKEKLGFANLEYNSLTAISSRGKNEMLVLTVLEAIMIDLSKIAQDFLLFSTSEFGFIELSDETTTGSSIMPQKKNADPLEILKSKAKIIGGYQNIMYNISTGLSSGYNRDVQDAKALLIDGIEITKQSLEVMGIVVNGLKINEENMKQSCTKEIFAADFAHTLVKNGVPFREAYKKVGQNLDNFIDKDLMKNNLKLKQGKGEPGDKNMLNVLGEKLGVLSIDLETKKNNFNKAVNKLITYAKHMVET